MKRMKIYHVLFSLLLGIGTVAVASYPALKSIREERRQDLEELIKLDDRLHYALVSRDFSALHKILSDDFELYTANGEVLSKGEFIRNIQKGGIDYDHIFETGARIKGNQLVRTNIISGKFWGIEGTWNIEATITAIDTSNRSYCKIKKVALKIL